MLRKLLLTTDFSTPAEKLMECIPEFQSLGTEEVVLLHVIDYRTGAGSATALKEHHENALNDYKRQLEGLGIKAKVIVVLGSAAAEIVEIARKEKVSLIVIGSHGAGSVKSIVMGSTTVNAVRLTDVPILIEKYKNLDSDECELACRETFQRIVVPIDFSPKSMAVVQALKGLGTTRSSITLVSAIESSWDQKDLDGQRSAAEERLENVQKELVDAGFSVTYEVRVGTASKNILDIANKVEGTLIVMSTLGAGSIRGLLLGSTADAVMRHSPIPVLLIPPQ